MTWYLDKTPAFGIRLGAHYCCRVTNAVCYLTKSRGVPLLAYIDNFNGWAASRTKVWFSFNES